MRRDRGLEPAARIGLGEQGVKRGRDGFVNDANALVDDLLDDRILGQKMMIDTSRLYPDPLGDGAGCRRFIAPMPQQPCGRIENLPCASGLLDVFPPTGGLRAAAGRVANDLRYLCFQQGPIRLFHAVFGASKARRTILQGLTGFVDEYKGQSK